MTAATAILGELRAAGIAVETVGERLRLNAPAGVLTPALLDRVRPHKPAILALIGSTGAVPGAPAARPEPRYTHRESALIAKLPDQVRATVDSIKAAFAGVAPHGVEVFDIRAEGDSDPAEPRIIDIRTTPPSRQRFWPKNWSPPKEAVYVCVGPADRGRQAQRWFMVRPHETFAGLGYSQWLARAEPDRVPALGIGSPKRSREVAQT